MELPCNPFLRAALTTIPLDIIFGVFCFVMTFHIYFTYPETCGRSLEEIEYIFEANLPPWRSNEARHKFAEDVEVADRRSDGSLGRETVKSKGSEGVERVEGV